MTKGRVELLTGRLAEKALRRLVGQWSANPEYELAIVVLPINVVSLAPMEWIGRHHTPAPETVRIVVPGLCQGDPSILSKKWNKKVDRGPEDYRDLAEFFKLASAPPDLSKHSIQILAEINHAPRLGRQAILKQALIWQAQGADLIDLGMDPGGPWDGVRDTVLALKEAGLRVSIDSFDPEEVRTAVSAGAELVLSVNGSNRERAPDWGVEVVVIPDNPSDLSTLWETADYLQVRGVSHRLDPILEPIGHGFGASLLRYAQTRKMFPKSPIMMGIGNLTEMTQVDSAGVNFLLLALCQEWGVGSILTTEVAGWCGASVREIARIRPIVFHSVGEGVVPKRLDPNVVVLGESKRRMAEPGALDEIAACLHDKNIRLFAENDRIEAMNGHFRLSDSDPFELFDKIQAVEPLDASHAFYLGYEMSKAVTALTLGKIYRQDAALNWGHFTRPEESHLKRRKERELL